MKIMKNYRKKYKLNIYACLLAATLLFMIGLFYRQNQYGNLQINTLDENLSIFVDNKKEKSKQDINPNFKLKSGEHSIIISKDNFWPWIKNIEIERKKAVEINPFFVPQNTRGLLIGEIDSEYASIMSQFEKNLILTEAFDKIINDNSELKSKITAIDFYKNRKDVVLIAMPDGIYALEIETENIQNLQPIYKGKNPVFAKKDNNSIYILDNGNLMLVNY